MKTGVIFRKYKDGRVIALFPERKKDHFTQPILSYFNHMYSVDTNYARVIKQTLPAREEDYAELYRELTAQDYDIKVITKRFVR